MEKALNEAVFTKIDSYALLFVQEIVANPNTSYVEVNAKLRTKIDFSKFTAKNARVIISGIGNETPCAGKGIEIYNVTDGAQICEVTWDGNAQQNALAGSWAACVLTAEKVITIRVKGCSATEDINIDRVELQLEFGR